MRASFISETLNKDFYVNPNQENIDARNTNLCTGYTPSKINNTRMIVETNKDGK